MHETFLTFFTSLRYLFWDVSFKFAIKLSFMLSFQATRHYSDEVAEADNQMRDVCMHFNLR